MNARVWLVVAALCGAAADARAETEPASTHAFLPGAFAPRVDMSWAEVTAGHDTALSSTQVGLLAEARVWHPFAVRAGLIAEAARQRPLVAVRAQLLRERRHGLDGALFASYEPEGFREAEGIMSIGVQGGRAVGTVDLAGATAYGQDPEGDDFQLTVQLAATTRIGRAHLGVAGRVRVDLFSDDVKRVGRGEADLDSALGPIASWRWQRFVLTAQIGGAAVRIDDVDRITLGVVGHAGAGAVF